ncbi:LytR/AlgR family response regulator transcription factor [Parapedobacter indicus]|uniref:Two component transcriptional regulator, LytTR family n=1 Tax=Parapedobacter indicus TaxID=1477437 RepID=A0A1I3CNB0_9SPHI|nr:LytTR family DNA-binding domain-containing protein [Parapedobacter indicus]PPL04325.1 LytTR family two component transcriptional regulator [Parapedobacter indicus]SFH76014.1 two component transcriptional regulator, LytTR family [Parapedobacter indicus]
MEIKTVIVDDEPHALDIIEKYIANFPDLQLVAKCSNAVQAFQILQKNKIDLLFLDIKMPGLLGTDLVRTLKNPPRIIFTTAYQDYALEGFDLNAVDYLLKPIPFDRFLKAMDKVFHGYRPDFLPIRASSSTSNVKNESFLYLRVDRKNVKLNVDDIYWVESLKDYIKVVLADKTYISKQKISVLAELLPEEKFVRIHRSFIVSIEKVQSYHSFAIEILGKELPIGRNYKDELRKRLR